MSHPAPTWSFSVPIRGFMLSGNSEQDIRRIQTGFSWASAPAPLLHQDASGGYVESVLSALRSALGS